MPTIDTLIPQLQAKLDQIASPQTRDWWQRYMRQVIPFRGVGIPQIREQLILWRAEQGIEAWDVNQQLRLALALFESPIAEDKLAGILYLQTFLTDRVEWQTLLAEIEQLYAKALIFDWNTCDWLCVRVLGPAIARHGMDCAGAVAAWAQASYLWQARSAVVAFVPVVSEARYDPLIYPACQTLIRREERFAKTAVGWILRDLSKRDPATVWQFVDQNLADFSVEALRNAFKYFQKTEIQLALAKLKSLGM